MSDLKIVKKEYSEGNNGGPSLDGPNNISIDS